MTDTALAPITEPQLDHSLLSKLESYEDYLSFYIQLEEASGAFAWLKADTLLQMTKKLGDPSLAQLARDLKQGKSTVINYVRTAKAFTPEQRIPEVSFSSHFQASLADSFNDSNGEWKTDKRFDWIKKAAENNYSSRQLAREVQSEKAKEIGQTNEQEAWKYDAMNKAAEMRSLIEGLIAGVKDNNKEAYDKLVQMYNRIYAQNS